MRIPFLLTIAFRRISSKTGFILLLCLGCGLLLGAISWARWLDFIEVRTLPVRMSLQSQLPWKGGPSASSVAVIQIDERSEQRWGAWPWSQGMFTPLVDALTETGANPVSLFFWFYRAGNDPELADAIRNHPIFLVKPYTESMAKPYPESRESNFPQIVEWLDLPPLLQGATAGSSFAYSNLDTKEGLYKIQLIAQKDKTLYYSLDLWLLCRYLGMDVDNLSNTIHIKKSFWYGNYLQVQRPDNPPLRIPIDEYGRLLVNFSTIHPTYDSYIDVLDRSDTINQGKYQNSIVLVGVTTDKWKVQTPFGPLTELDLHAQGINTILSSAMITRLSKPVNMAYTLLICLTFAIAVSLTQRGKLRRSLLWAIASALGVYILILSLTTIAGVWVDMVNPLLAMGLCSSVALGYHQHSTEQMRRAEHEKRVRAQWTSTTIHALAHSLKNMCISISQEAQAIESQLPHTKSDVRAMVHAIQGKTDQMILDFQELFCATGEIYYDTFSLTDLVDSLVARILNQNQIWSTKISLIKQYTQECTITADKPKIGLAIESLVTNACEAMQVGGGTLIIRLQADAHQVLLVIKDTGVGIPAEDLEYIYDINYTSKKNGTGLGLWIARQIVKEMHNGELSITSRLSRGTTAKVQLPMIPSHPEGRNKRNVSQRHSPDRRGPNLLF